MKVPVECFLKGIGLHDKASPFARSMSKHLPPFNDEIPLLLRETLKRNEPRHDRSLHPSNMRNWKETLPILVQNH